MKLRKYCKYMTVLSIAGSLTAPAMAQTDGQDLDFLLQGLATAGRQEVSLSPPTSSSLEGFSDRLDQALRLQGNTGESTDDGNLTAADRQVIELFTNARSYSEAKLLAQVIYSKQSAIPTLPSELLQDSDDGDWQFDGYSPEIPELIVKALQSRRDARDEVLDTLKDSQFDTYARFEETVFAVQKEETTKARGLRFDPRPNLYALETRDGQMWLRKQPTGYVPSDVDRGEGSVGTAGEGFPELDRPLSAGPSKAIVGGNIDNRELRSEWNGFNMQSTVWKPKGAITRLSASSGSTPPEVECTGVKISRRLVVTAGHCLFKDGSWNSNRKWLPGADGIAEAMGVTNDPSPNGFKTSQWRIVRGNWHAHEWANYDFGLMVLWDNASSCNLAWHGWWKTSLLNKTVHLYGYPGETRDCSASPLNSDNCHGSIYGDGGTITYAGSYQVRYPIDTQPGQSGTGFYRIHNGGRYVVGVHKGAWSSTRNRGIRINNGNRNMINNALSDHPANACN